MTECNEKDVTEWERGRGRDSLIFVMMRFPTFSVHWRTLREQYQSVAASQT